MSHDILLTPASRCVAYPYLFWGGNLFIIVIANIVLLCSLFMMDLLFEGCLTVQLPHEIMWNTNLMQQGKFIDVFLARHVLGACAHHQELHIPPTTKWAQTSSPHTNRPVQNSTDHTDKHLYNTAYSHYTHTHTHTSYYLILYCA